MIIIETVGIEVFEVSDIVAEGVNVGLFEPVTEHFG